MSAVRFARRSVIAFFAMLNISIAGTWTETNDTGALPVHPQILAGSGELSAIYGNISGLDVDLFRIYLSDPAHTFSALQSVPLGGDQSLGPQLFLFNDSGFGVASTAGSAPGLYSSALMSPAHAGYYWLGVAPSNIDPYTGKVQLFPGWSVSDYPLFLECNSSPCGLTSQGAQYSLGGWGGNYHGIESPYAVQLAGAYFSDPGNLVPEPSALSVIAFCLFALCVCRGLRPIDTSR